MDWFCGCFGLQALVWFVTTMKNVPPLFPTRSGSLDIVRILDYFDISQRRFHIQKGGWRDETVKHHLSILLYSCHLELSPEKMQLPQENEQIVYLPERTGRARMPPSEWGRQFRVPLPKLKRAASEPRVSDAQPHQQLIFIKLVKYILPSLLLAAQAGV